MDGALRLVGPCLSVSPKGLGNPREPGRIKQRRFLDVQAFLAFLYLTRTVLCFSKFKPTHELEGIAKVFLSSSVHFRHFFVCEASSRVNFLDWQRFHSQLGNFLKQNAPIKLRRSGIILAPIIFTSISAYIYITNITSLMLP